MNSLIFGIERFLLEQVSKAYIDGGEGTQDDKEFFKAFSAVQDLRNYLEKKEGTACTPN